MTVNPLPGTTILETPSGDRTTGSPGIWKKKNQKHEDVSAVPLTASMKNPVSPK